MHTASNVILMSQGVTHLTHICIVVVKAFSAVIKPTVLDDW